MTPYILHVAIILTGCLAFYKILLQRETFFRLNRMILLLCLALSFGLPLLPVPHQWSFRKADGPLVNTSGAATGNSAAGTDLKIQKDVPPSQPVEPTEVKPTTVTDSYSLAQFTKWLFYFYWFGVAAFALNFLLQMVSLVYRAYSRPVIKDGRFRIVELAGDKAPCSFGNNIFINPEKYDWDTYNQILLHEKIHIQQGHTFDILLAELVLIFQWFNPVAWLYRKELECNLEFLTDSKLLEESAVEKTSYQVSLLRVSAPHFPLSLTTNYNQSLLKKRLVMMNAKRSNINTTWKYFFLLPLAIAFVCLLNKPVVYGQSNDVVQNKKQNDSRSNSGMEPEGAWFATVKGDKVSVQFRNDDEGHNSFNGNTFPLSEFKGFPEAKSYTFVRDAGTMQLTGKFEGEQGMGRYKFTGDKSFSDFLKTEGVRDTDEDDLMAFFFVGVTKTYLQTLKEAGYRNLQKNDLLPLAALKIDAEYIKSIKSNGFPDISVQDLIPFKSLGINAEYIQDIRKAGYQNVSSNQLISFKAQGIDGKYVADVRAAAREGRSNSDQNNVSGKNTDRANSRGVKEERKRTGRESADKDEPADNNENVESDNDSRDDADYIISYKALNIDADYVRSIKESGFGNISRNNLIAMKAQGITSDYIKSIKAMGYPDISASDVIAMKAQNITSDYLKGFNAVGFNKVRASDLIALKALNITPTYVKSFTDAGYPDISVNSVISMKAQHITPEIMKEYKALGFSNLSVEDVIGAKATGTSPGFIASMKQKGHNLKSIDKYIQLKVAIDD